MSPDIFLVILVGLGVMTFGLKLYRTMLTSGVADVATGTGGEAEDLLARRLHAIDQCRKMLDVLMLTISLGIACTYVYHAWLG
jgi:hypothetical protein